MDFIALQRAKLHYVFENIFHVVERLVSEKEAKMNKIFKVIWSKSKQCYVVVSELAKNTTGKKKIVVAGIFSALAIVQFGQVAQVQADGAIGSSTHKGSLAINGTWKAGYSNAKATDENAIAIGQDAQATGRGGVALGNETRSVQNALAAAWDAQATSKNAVALGTGTRAMGLSSTAVGAGAQATVYGAVALGTGTRATGLSSTAVGDSAQATADGAVALGQSTESAGNSVAAGYNAKARSNNTVAIGVEANNDGGITNNASSVSVGVATRARAVGSMAMGVSADASGKYSLALGSGDVSGDYTDGNNHPSASGEKSIAIGYNSNASDESDIALGDSSKAKGGASISIGKDSKAEDQNAVAIGVDSHAKTIDSIAVGNNAKATGAVSTALGARAEALGTSAVAVGINAKAKKDQATALGFSAQANEKNSVALGYSAISSQENAVALGSASTTTTNATSQGSFVIGGKTITWNGAPTVTGTGMQVSVGSAGAERQIKNVAAGAVSPNSTDAINGSQLYAVADALRTKYVSIKSNATGTSSNENNDGATGTDSIAIGPKASATQPNATALGKGAGATDSNSTAIGTGAQATGSSSVALGDSANASSSQAIAIGKSTVASQYDAVAIGNGSKATASYTLATNGGAASGLMSISIGSSTEATKENAVAVGYNSKANGESSVAISGGTTEAEKAIAIGTDAQATKEGSIAQGWKSLASSKGTVAIGGSTDSTELGAQATELYASAYGNQATASGQYSTALGNQSTASQSHATAVGHLANATADSAAAIGYNARAQGTYAFAAVGGQAIGVDTIAIGRDSVANTIGSIAQGKGANAQGGSSIAIGSAYGTNAGAATNGENAIALGAGSSSTANNALALGLNANSSATDSIAVGLRSQSNALSGVAIGADSQASVEKGIALGAGSKANVVSGVAGYNANTENIARTDKYAGLTGVALNSNLGALSVGVTDASGAATSTRQIVGVAAGKADTDAVNVAQLKSVNLTFTGNSGSGDVNLSKSKLAVEGGTDSFITTTAANKKLEINTTQGKLKTTSGTVSVDGNNGLAVAQNVADVINQANADRTITYKANGTGSNSVKLSDGLNFTNGTTTTATVGTNGQVSFDLNTTTQKSITDSATAVARTISLGGDTGTTTAKSLTSSNVNFGVKSGSPTYLTTTANGNDVTLTINEQAIKNAAKDASSFKVKANATAAEDVKGGDTVAFNNGDNIAITQTGKTFKIATAKNVTFDTATIGTNTTIGSTGVSTNKVTVGNISIDGTDGINAGGKIITNVGTGRVSNSSTDDGNVANIGDVKAIANDAVANLSTSLGVTDGTNNGTVNLKNQSLKVVGTGVAKATVNGQTITVDVAKGTLTNNTTTGALTGTAGVVDANDMATAVNTAITKAVDTATGTQKLDISAGGTDSSVNLKTQKLTVAGTGAATASLTNQTITVNVAEGTFTNKSDGTTSATAGVAKATDVAAAINNANTVLGNKITAATQSLSTLGDNKFKLTADSTSTTGQALNQSGGLSFKIAGDGALVSTKATTADTIQVSVKKGTLSTNTDGTINKAADGVVTADNMTTVVNDAITKAVTSAKDGSAWNISTNGGTATKVSGGNTVDLKGGDNIVIEQDPTDGKKITVKTKKDLTLDSVTAANTVKVGSGTNLITLDGTSGAVSGNTFTAGNASMNTTGFRLTGGPSVTTSGIDAGNKVITNVASGGTTSTNAANIGDITKAISDLTTNLTKNTNIAYTANSNTSGQTVSLKDGFNFSNGTLTTAEVAANGVVKFNVTQGSLSTDGNGNITNTAGVATTDDVKNAVNTAITKAVDNATGTQKLDISAGGTDSSVNLKTQKLTVAGTGAATASLTNQTITVNVAEGTFTNKSDGTTSATAGVAKATDVAAAINNANTVLGNKITAATQSLSTLGDNKFKLTADSTSTTGQALNQSGGLSFKIAGDGALVSTKATTADTIQVSVKKGTLSTNTDGTINKAADGVVTADNMTTVVNDAITKAVTSAKDGSAWNISTNGGTATKVSGGNTVDLKGGDNIVIEQDPTDGKKITVKTKKDLTLDSVTAANTVKVGSGTNLITLDGTTGAVSGNSFTAGNASMNTTGFRLTGGPSMTTAGIDAGNKQITNLASGGTTATNAANIGDINAAISSLTTNLGKNTTIAYKANNAGGQTVSLADGFNFTNGTLTTAEVGASGVVKFNVTQGALSTDTNGTVSAGTAGVATTADVASAVNSAVSTAVNNATSSQKLDISAGGTDSSVNLKTQKLTVAGTGAATASLTNQTITVNVAEGTFTNKSDGTTSATAGVAKATDVAAAINNANTVLGNKITAATQSLSTLGDNKFKLTADSTSTTGQALNQSGGLSFKIAGDGALVSTKATTADTIQVSVKKGTLSTNTDGTINKAADGVVTADNMTTVVNDAITKAVTSAKDGSAWNISTNGGTATKVSGGNTVDLKGGDNIVIEQDPTDGKKITVKTKKDLTLDSVTAANTVKVGSGTNLITLDGTSGAVSGNTFTAGNASMNTTGFRLTGGPSVTTSGIDAGNKVITNVASGGTTSTNAANIGDITKAISDLTTNLTKNTNIAYTANSNTSGQTVSLKDGFNFSNGTLTTAEVAANGVVKFNVTQGSLSTDGNGNITNTAGVATTDDVKNAVSTAINTAVTKATGSQVLNITDGTNNDSINLKNDTLKVVGADGVTTAVSGKTITVGLDTATKNKINNASTAANRNISLAADSGTTSSQSLKDGDVSFAVKGATGDYISTNMNGSTVAISTKRATIDSDATTGQASVTGNDGLATAKNVADAINAATAKAVSQSAWKLAADGTTGTETISGGDTVNFKAGSNMEVSRTGKDITYKTKDNVAFTTVTAGTGANEVKLDGNTGTVTAKDITATGDVTAKNVTTSGNVTAAGTVKGDTVQGNTVKAGNVTITGGTTNTITGLSNTTWTPAGGIQADRAATEGQLQQAINQVNATVGSTALTFKGDTNPAQSMTLQGNTFAITGDTMIKTTTNTNGIGLSLDTSKVNIAYAANGLNGQTTSIASGFNFTDGDHTKATVAASGVVKYDAKTSTISVANGHATSSGTDLATADNVADAINQMTQNNSGNTTQLRQEISKVATETQRVGAHAAAMAALKPIQYDPLAPTQIMAGVGNYRGESAAALGIAHYTNDNTMFNVGVSVGGNHNMINAGVTHKFGISAEKKNIPDRYKAGPISSIYVMQDEMTQLRSENEAYKAKLDKQQSEIDALKAAVDQLLASKA